MSYLSHNLGREFVRTKLYEISTYLERQDNNGNKISWRRSLEDEKMYSFSSDMLFSRTFRMKALMAIRRLESMCEKQCPNFRESLREMCFQKKKKLVLLGTEAVR